MYLCCFPIARDTIAMHQCTTLLSPPLLPACALTLPVLPATLTQPWKMQLVSMSTIAPLSGAGHTPTLAYHSHVLLPSPSKTLQKLLTQCKLACIYVCIALNCYLGDPYSIQKCSQYIQMQQYHAVLGVHVLCTLYRHSIYLVRYCCSSLLIFVFSCIQLSAECCYGAPRAVQGQQ